MSGTFTVRLQRPGADPLQFEAPADLPVLLAAERAGLAMESSCRNGTCRSCICFMDAGSVAYRVAWPGLSLDEKREGWILPCVAYATGDLQLSLPL
ncbi:2Fe-2S iron-sulfur cluster binding domain-containing protein [Pseudorhodoferax sp. LjRoot39]|uniref:2Fe-2S iron-sulfur cluster-binding protein n=1 Tax=Pseudorhodoferax sp. LjRoot39 TaxID=3342328 RepID=UPI003ECF90C3